MATPLRKYFWLVTTTFIALAVLLLASTSNLFVEFAFSPRIPGMRDEQALSEEAASRPRTALEGSRLAKLTGLTFDKSPEEAAPSGGSAAMNTSLRLKLLGTLVAHDSKWSLASLEDLDAKRIRSVMTGDALQGARVVSIERERITFLVDGREEFIRADRHGGASPAPVLANVAPVQTGVRTVGEHTYEVSRRAVEDALANMDGLLTQARVVPAFRDGKPQGFKVFSIKKGSLYEQLGIQSGDVLRRINGVSLDTPDRALEAFTLLRGAPHLELDIERGGSPVRKVYDVW
ncbi:type II secretion system protein GspC [Myxococcus sp. AM010]|uniref:type II secretion system protein GspC n=1 Tax=Myxococcus sp. AM010 TaxID=2745138 RepID=UPI0015955D34|nr:type II secretion system protein GspC [Myxococcus sp. AM010]NVJ13677.1 general secretion pathway protein GspC [Myxococcus sp. AM010]